MRLKYVIHLNFAIKKIGFYLIAASGGYLKKISINIYPAPIYSVFSPWYNKSHESVKQISVLSKPPYGRRLLKYSSGSYGFIGGFINQYQ